jgi:hypothetical protein
MCRVCWVCSVPDGALAQELDIQAVPGRVDLCFTWGFRLPRQASRAKRHLGERGSRQIDEPLQCWATHPLHQAGGDETLQTLLWHLPETLGRLGHTPAPLTTLRWSRLQGHLSAQVQVVVHKDLPERPPSPSEATPTSRSGAGRAPSSRADLHAEPARRAAGTSAPGSAAPQGIGAASPPLGLVGGLIASAWLGAITLGPAARCAWPCAGVVP